MDAVQRSSKLQFVKEQLAMYSGQKVAHADYTFVLCPSHSEKTPSARIFHYPDSKSPGYMKCYACGANFPWDELAPKLGLEPYKRGKPKDQFANLTLNSLHNLLKDDGKGFVKRKMKFQKLQEGQKWRHIKTDLLMQVGAKLCKVYNEEGDYWSSSQMYLPCMINGEVAGYILGRLEKHETLPSYINASGRWSKVRGLFPFDRAIRMMKKKKSTTMVLVEGPRDALRLIQMGIPAMCILGTQSWGDNKSKLLEIAGITRVVLMMDGDCAGRDATEMLQPKLEKMFKVKTVKLWAMKGSPYHQVKHEKNPSKAAKKLGLTLYDPGNVPAPILKKLKEKYYPQR